MWEYKEDDKKVIDLLTSIGELKIIKRANMVRDYKKKKKLKNLLIHQISSIKILFTFTILDNSILINIQQQKMFLINYILTN